LDDDNDALLDLGFRFSDIESVCPEPVDESTNRGCCAVTATRDVCESSVPLPSSHTLYNTYGFANFEIEDTKCGYRECVSFDVAGGKTEDRCIIVYDSFLVGDWYESDDFTTNRRACTRKARRKDKPLESVKVAGECYQGICQITKNNHPCPEPYETIEYTVTDCLEQNFGFTWDNLGGNAVQGSNVDGEESYDACYSTENTGKCQAFGRQTKEAYCWSNSWNQAQAGNEQQEDVDTAFFTYFYDPYDVYGSDYDALISGDPSNSDNRVEVSKMGHLGEVARCIIAQPEATDLNKECVIEDVGYYQYKGMNITWWTTYTGEAANPDGRMTALIIPIQTRSLVPVVSCPATKVCAGTIQCSWNLSQEGNFPCNGEFSFCENHDPTLDPTVDPTTDPTHSPSRSTTAPPTFYPTNEPSTSTTAHGDPIIWTFNDECYDLNKNGLYTATYHPTFDHWVNIGVHNDFMREIQVIRSDGEILLAINNLGMVESENYPFYFNQTINDCPVDMKKTECPETYVEFEWDTQDFRYYAQILRHDYLDPALKEGELGYHLDVQPRPFASFQKRKKEYKGLFFENPLPDELEFCEGGSPRHRR